MRKYHNIVGVVLAGGRSSRMGQDKAFLEYHGKPLVAHMLDVLRSTGVEDVIVSGHVEGYDCVVDDAPFSGPAAAIRTLISSRPSYDGFLFVPVDMPLLTSDILKYLLEREEGGYFIDWPLPAFITRPCSESKQASVQGILDDYGVYPVHLPEHFLPFMKNANTPKEWKGIVRL